MSKNVGLLACLFCGLQGMLGCTAGSTLMLIDVGGDRRLKSSDAVDIAIDADADRADPYTDPLGVSLGRKVQTGPFWHRAFIGDPKGSFELHIVEASLRGSLEAMGFVSRFTYFIDAELIINGRAFPIHAEGSRATGGMDPRRAMRQSIELGILETAQEADKIKAKQSTITTLNRVD